MLKLFALFLFLSLFVSEQLTAQSNAEIVSFTTCDKETAEPIIKVLKDSVGKRITPFLIAHNFEHVKDALFHRNGCVGWLSEQSSLASLFRLELPAACASVAYAMEVKSEKFDEAIKSIWLTSHHGASVFIQTNAVVTQPGILGEMRTVCAPEKLERYTKLQEDSLRRKYRMICKLSELYCTIAPMKHVSRP